MFGSAEAGCLWDHAPVKFVAQFLQLPRVLGRQGKYVIMQALCQSFWMGNVIELSENWIACQEVVNSKPALHIFLRFVNLPALASLSEKQG